MKREQLHITNKRTVQNRISLSITYNRYLSNISNIITKHRSILQITPTPLKVFDNKPMITYMQE